MNDLNNLKRYLDNHRAQFPNARRFPSKFWISAIELSEKYSHIEVAKILNIDLGNLTRRIKESRKKKNFKSTDQDFVQLPIMAPKKVSSKQMTIELPHNIILRIDL